MCQFYDNLISDRRSYQITADLNIVYDIKINTPSPCFYCELTHDICPALETYATYTARRTTVRQYADIDVNMSRYVVRHNAKTTHAISMGTLVSSDTSVLYNKP